MAGYLPRDNVLSRALGLMVVQAAGNYHHANFGLKYKTNNYM